MSTPPVFLPRDLTGDAPDNFISGEYHQITGGHKTIIRPNFGNFYAKGFQLFGVSSQTNLTLMRAGIDYSLGQLNEQATADSAGDVYQVVLIKDVRFFTTFSISYQAFGGPENINYTRLHSLYYKAKGGIPTEWSQLTNTPDGYTPVAHTNDAKDLYGLEYVNDFVQSIGQAMLLSNTSQASAGALRFRLRDLETHLQSASALLYTVAHQHMDNTGYAHAYSKAMVGLGNVANYDIVPLTINGVTLPAYAHPQILAYWTNNPPSYSPPEHISLTDNPHGSDKVAIGLGLLQNYALQNTYDLGTDQYNDLFSSSGPTVYLGPAAFAGGVSEYAQTVFTTVTEPIITAANEAAQAAIAQAVVITGLSTDAIGSANELIVPLQASVANIDQLSQRSAALDSRFDIVSGNSIYSELLIQLLLQDREANNRNAAVYDQGYYPIPAKVDGLELWLSANNPQNSLLVGIDGHTRVVKLVDQSARARVFAAPANTAPILAVPQDITSEVSGMTKGMTMLLSPGLALDQLSGPALQLRAGMTVIALVRTGALNTRLNLLTSPGAISDTGIYGYTSDEQLLAIRSGGPWSPLEAPKGAALPNASGIIIGVVSERSEQYCWSASSQPTNYIPYPRGVDTPASNWANLNYRSAALTQIGNPNFGFAHDGELTELLVYRRALKGPEVRAIVEYLKTRYSDGHSLSVDFAALNAF